MRKISQHIYYICAILFLIYYIVVPISFMLCRITSVDFIKTIQSQQFQIALINSITVSTTAALISLLLAIVAAFCVERTSIKFIPVLKSLFLLPMLVPSISHAFSLVTLFGRNGLILQFLTIDWSIYGFCGIVTGSIMYSFPIAFLILSNVLCLEDGTAHKAAKVLGVPAFYRFYNLTLPFLKKSITLAFCTVFTMVFTDYGVPLMIGGKTITLPVLMYNKAIAMIDYSSGSVISIFLLIPAIITFLFDWINPNSTQDNFMPEPVEKYCNKYLNMFAYMFCALLSLCALIPIFAFCVVVFETKYPFNTAFTLSHITKTFHRGAWTYLINSVIYAFLTAAIGSAVTFTFAYMTTRYRSESNQWLANILHLLSLVPMACPGIVLGLSYVIFFNGSIIYGTIAIITIANLVHFFTTPYLMTYNALGKVNPDLENVGLTLGIKRVSIITDVILPKIKGSLCEIFSYFFINSMMTISAVSFLAPPAPKPLALMINQFEAQLLLESAAFVSLLILITNVLMKVIVCKFNKL